MKRIFGLDLIRFLAIFFVISVHFFLNNGFYNTPIKGGEMFFSLVLRWLFYSGVPLFMLLTGYLKRNKELNKKYYKGIYSVLASYLFISIICILFRIFYLGEKIGKSKAIVYILNFSADGYAWYIEMYLGLFLLIPFLNIIYNNLKNRNEKKLLIITLGILVSLCPIFNYIPIHSFKLDIIPNYWMNIYPLIYYFIGCYINEYQPKINKKTGILLIITLILFEAIITYFFNYKKLFSGNFLGGYGSIQTVMISTIIFLLLYKIKCNKKLITKFVSSVSILSLDMYLFSYIVDNVIYDKLNETPQSFLKYYIIIVITVFLTTYILSLMKKYLFVFIKKIVRKKEAS